MIAYQAHFLLTLALNSKTAPRLDAVGLAYDILKINMFDSTLFHLTLLAGTKIYGHG